LVTAPVEDGQGNLNWWLVILAGVLAIGLLVTIVMLVRKPSRP
jgi:hypothetical protein